LEATKRFQKKRGVIFGPTITKTPRVEPILERERFLNPLFSPEENLGGTQIPGPTKTLPFSPNPIP